MANSAEIVSLDNKRDYVEVKTDNGDTHLIPISVFRHIASGKLTVNRVADFIPIYKEITRQWLKLKGY